jgi:hypothetical protein
MSRGEAAEFHGRTWTFTKVSRAVWEKVYIASLSVLALGLAVLLCYIQFYVPSLVPDGPFPWAGLVILASIALFAERYSIRARPGLEVSAAFLAFLLSAAIVGPVGGLITGAVSDIVLARRNAIQRSVWYVVAAALVAGTTGLAYWLLMAAAERAGASALMVAGVGLAAGILFQLVNVIVVSPMYWIRRRMGLVTVWREAAQPFLAFHFFFLAISLGLIYIYRLYANRAGGALSELYSTLLILLCLLPVLGLIYAFRAFAHERELAQRNEALALRNEKLFLQAVKSQVTALDVKDNYTARHSAAVARWATDIAEAMALSKREQNITHLASLVHDVGKIGVPDEVLNHPGRLDGQAWRMVETHCQNGHKILKTIDQFDELAEVILSHHEKYDGSGYPQGLAGGSIPLISRIICVADSYSAMVSDRPYRKALPVRMAKNELRKCAGTQFDPEVVDAFLGVLAGRDSRYQSGRKVDFDLEFSSDRFLRELPDQPSEV